MESAPTQPPDPRQATLDRLAEFVERLLPTALRRLAQWKGFDTTRHQAVVEDLRQELALDALSHAAELVDQPTAVVHARWFRLVQSVHYQLCERPTRREVGTGGDLDHLPAQVAGQAGFAIPSRETTERPAARDQHVFDRLAAAAVHLHNGRLNAIATADRLGLTKREFRELWERLTTQLGFGREFLEFWRARLREAGMRLGVDLLRASGVLHTFGTAERHQVADPDGHTRRIRRVRTALSSHPLHHDSKRVFVETLSRKRRDPESILDAVAQLEGAPHAPLALWRFEAAIANEEPNRAARHLAEAETKQTATEQAQLRVPCVLANARLLEALGDPRTAIDVLRKARVWDDDERLRISLRSLERGLDGVE